MVRQVEMSGSIDNVNFQKAFGILFGDEKFMKRYHKEISKDPAAQVSKWSGDGRREVKFSAPVNAPKVVQMVLGADKLEVTEIQQYSKMENSIVINSEPILQAPGGSSFRTLGKVVLAPGENSSSCRVTMLITLECTAAVWGVQGTVESYMETHARKSFGGWMRIAQIFCQEELGQTHKPAFDEDDEYFDFEEEEGPFSGVGSPSSSSLADRDVVASGEDEQIGVDMWFVRSVLKDLNSLHISGDASRTHIEKLNVKLQKIEDDLSIIKSHLEKQNNKWIQATWGFLALGIAVGLIFGIRRLYLRPPRK